MPTVRVPGRSIPRTCIFCGHHGRLRTLQEATGATGGDEYGICHNCHRAQKWNPECIDCRADGVGMALWRNNGRCESCARQVQALTGESYEEARARSSDRVDRVFMRADYNALEMRIAADAMKDVDDGKFVNFHATTRVRLTAKERPSRFERKDVI